MPRVYDLERTALAPRVLHPDPAHLGAFVLPQAFKQRTCMKCMGRSVFEKAGAPEGDAAAVETTGLPIEPGSTLALRASLSLMSGANSSMTSRPVGLTSVSNSFSLLVVQTFRIFIAELADGPQSSRT